jgi:hypothetical protein
VGAADEVPDHDDDQLEPDDEGDGEQLLCARRARPLPGGQQAQPTHRLQEAAQPARQLGVLGLRFLEEKIDGAELEKDTEGRNMAAIASGLILKGCEDKVDDTSHTLNLDSLRTDNAILAMLKSGIVTLKNDN